MDSFQDLAHALALADLLCGAAASDTHVAASEIGRVIASLETIVGSPLPDAVRDRVGSFVPSTFDLDATLVALGTPDEGERRMVLEAVVDVACADRFVDSSELEFIADVAQRLGLPMPRIG